MSKATKQTLKRFIAVFLSVTLAFSPLAVKPRQAQAGSSSFSLGSVLGKVALSAVKGSLVWGLGKAQDATTNEAMSSVFGAARAVVAGKQRILAEQTIDLIKEVSAQLDALYDYTVTSTTDIENMIKNLTWKEAKDRFTVYAATPVDRFNSKYDGMVRDVNDLVEAYVKYEEDPSDDNEATLEQAYSTVYNDFNSKDVDTLFITPLIGDVDTAGFLPIISPYNPNVAINETSDMTSNWGEFRSGASVDTTYLGYYYDYVTQVTNLQSNVYDSMADAATIVDNAAYLYLQAYRYYCEFEAMLLASDSSLSESELRSQETALWNGFYDASYKLIRGINQMYDTQEKVFTTYMRTSDVAMTRSIANYSNPTPFKTMLEEYEDANGYSGIIYYEHDVNSGSTTPTTNIYTSAIQKDQHIYQFRLMSAPDKLYAIRTSSHEGKENNGASQAFYVHQMVMVAPTNGLQDQTVPSADTFAVLKGLEGGFVAPVSMSELSDIAAGTITAYDTSKTMTDNLRSEFGIAFGSDNVYLPEVTLQKLSTDEDDIKYGPNLMPLRTQLDWYELYNIFENPDGRMTLGNASMPYSTGNQAYFDLEDDLRDYTGYEDNTHLESSEAVVMWVCKDPSFTLGLSGSEGGDTSATVGDAKLGNGQSGTYDPGTAVTISATPHDGYTISSVQLVNKDGAVLEDLLSQVTLNDGTTISAQEILSVMKPNAGGAYEFTVPVPCQDATIKVNYAPIDESLLTYDVTLNDVKDESGNYSAVLQFGSYDYLNKKSFKAGEQVIVSVVGYNSHVATGLTITDANGNAVDVRYEDVSDQRLRTRPSERLYAFDMVAQDLNVTPTLGSSHTVTVLNSYTDKVTHEFQNLNLYDMGGDTDWAHAEAVDYVEGSTVAIAYQVKEGNVVTKIEVFDSNNKAVQTSHEANGPLEGSFSFTMPASKVSVRFTTEEVNTQKHALTLASVEGETSLRFVGEDGVDPNLSSMQVKPGATVTVKATLLEDENYCIDDIVLTAEGSTDNIFAAQDGEYVAETGIITFKMPDADATLKVTARECTPEEKDGLDIDDEGRIEISSYENLVAFANAVRRNPEHYSAADAVLVNNINANGKDPWAYGIGSHADNIEYNGTFDGNGYCIFGMTMTSSGVAALFEVIGKNGVVKNIFMFDCDTEGRATWAAGIAGNNKGRIEHCVNGLNLTNGVYVKPDTGDLISLREYNSSVEGEFAAGIAALNNGEIYACRSSAVVNGEKVGSIAGYNYDTISNCAGNSSVAVTNTSGGYAGGIAGENYEEESEIIGGYSSATVSSDSGFSGNIVGRQEGSVTDTYYTTSEGQRPWQSTGMYATDSGVNGLSRGSMMQDSFLDQLSATGSNSVTWLRHDALNAGLPRIKNPSAVFADVVFTKNGVTTKGNLHRSAKVATNKLRSGDEAWQKLLEQKVDGYTPSAAYACTIQDAAGNHIPAELWSQSSMTLSLEVKSKDIRIALLMNDGTTKLVDDLSFTELQANGASTQAAKASDDGPMMKAMRATADNSTSLADAQVVDDWSSVVKLAADESDSSASKTKYSVEFIGDGATAFMVYERARRGESDNNGGNNGSKSDIPSNKTTPKAAGTLAKTGDTNWAAISLGLLVAAGGAFGLSYVTRKRKDNETDAEE